MKFPVVIRPGEDGYFVAECPVLPGCMSQGKTEKEALANIREAIELWLEVEAEKQARKLPKDAVLRAVAV
ncbi:MAG: type II toxin-antitoxin system HicB family antitoxin [Chloroflexota bacterium]|nr:MAG: type II toxin-antitoxin system HicB family antitoxin [Chloroflexota bacterium]